MNLAAFSILFALVASVVATPAEDAASLAPRQAIDPRCQFCLSSCDDGSDYDACVDACYEDEVRRRPLIFTMFCS